MLRVLLIWVVTLLGTPNQSLSQPPEYYCYEYTLTVAPGVHRKTNEVRYKSTLSLKKQKYLFTVSTTRRTLTFAILKTFSEGAEERTMFAVIAGQPDQLYVIRELSREKTDRYFFSVHPINQRVSEDTIYGYVLEVSNQANW